MSRDTLLWLCLLGGPLIWFLSFVANFALAPWACSLQWKPALFWVSALALVVIAGCGFSGWSQWRRLGREYPGEASGEIANARVLASGAVLMNALFFLVVATQAIVESILGACQ